MRKITVFNFVTLNGYFKGPGGNILTRFAEHGLIEEGIHVAEA